MKITLGSSKRGIALMIVMIAIFVLAVLAGAFAYSMKVEITLARNVNNEPDLVWLGRSGVEMARYVLAQQLSVAGEPYDSLNQKWAGGPGGIAESNSPLADISLQNVPVGDGKITVKITDLERKININTADQMVLQQALAVVGVDASEVPTITDSILDWIDPDDNPHINGTESDYYQNLDPPYSAKNGPMDDLAELLLVRGITPDMSWGSASTNHMPAAFQRPVRFGSAREAPTYPVGLVDVFTPISTGRVNINTASATVLAILLGGDETMAENIIQMRAGPDKVDGTDDDTPINNVGELINAGVNPQLVPQLSRYCDVRSRTFEVQVDAEIVGSHRTFFAILGRNSPRDIQVLSFYWKE